MLNNILASSTAKITWDVTTRDGLHAVMFNGNGVWFEYIKRVSVSHLKTLIRSFSKHVPIHTVSIRKLSDVGTDNCEYRCFYSSINNGFTISKRPKSPDEVDLAYYDLSDLEFASLLGNPSRLLADYWDEFYVPGCAYQLRYAWEDGDPNRQLNANSIGKINLCRLNEQSAGTMEQTDEGSGVTHIFEWAITHDLESVLKRAVWLSKGNKPEQGR